MLIDTDVHNDFGDIAEYLPRVWRDRWRRVGIGAGSVHEGNPRGVLRRDAQPPDGGPPASDPVFLLTDHLDHHDIDYAILTGPGGVPLGPDADYSNALASAYNDCMVDVWLPVSPFKGSSAGDDVGREDGDVLVGLPALGQRRPAADPAASRPRYARADLRGHRRRAVRARCRT